MGIKNVIITLQGDREYLTHIETLYHNIMCDGHRIPITTRDHKTNTLMLHIATNDLTYVITILTELEEKERMMESMRIRVKLDDSEIAPIELIVWEDFKIEWIALMSSRAKLIEDPLKYDVYLDNLKLKPSKDLSFYCIESGIILTLKPKPIKGKKRKSQ